MSQFGVVAAASFGNVVKQRGDIQDPGLSEVGHQLTAEWIFVRMFAHGEAAHIAHHHQDVLVDGIDVKQVVLHLADNAAEIRQVTTEHAGLIHAAQSVGNTALALNDLHEQRVIVRIAAEGIIDFEACMPERAHGSAPTCF